MKYIVENFASIRDLIKSNETRQFNNIFSDPSKRASNKSDSGFSGTKSYEEAVELLKSGYAEPLDKIKRGVEANLRENTTKKTRVKNDIVGYAPCVPNAILGIPQSMINKENAAKKSKIITITHDSTAACYVTKEEFIKAGIVTLTIVNSLEANGYRVELKVVFNHSREGNEKIFASVTLKDWRQPLDLKKMCFPFCHPSMLRRIGFRYTETQPQIKNSGWSWGYGRSEVSARGYYTLLDELRQNHLIKENEKYINLDLCKENQYDPQRIIKACGLE